MIRFVFGLPGTGKTAWITDKIQKDVKDGKKAILLVPEQQTVEVERTMLALLPPSAQLNFEVLNFSRLANKLFRMFGGLSYNYITTGTKHLLMWHTLQSLAPTLKEYGSKSQFDTALPAKMLAQVHEFKAHGKRPVSLAEALDQLDESQPLYKKLEDIALIYATYDELVKRSFDDGTEDLDKLSALLEEHNTVFANYNVYVDSFTSFTAQEHTILKRLFAQADNVTVALSIDSLHTHAPELASIKKTAVKLTVDAGADKEIITLDRFHRFSSPELERIGQSLWRFHVLGDALPPIAEQDQGAVSVLCCDNPYAEAEAAANTVLTLLHRGYRRQEIAIIARDAESYRGIIDVALEKAGIPYFLSEKTDLPTKPLISMILAALNIKIRNWRMNDVITYIKSGIPDISLREADMFERYVSRWNISGNQFFGDDWVLNPNGYGADFSDREAEILATANYVKKKITLPLLRLFTHLNEAACVSDQCEALRRFLEETNVPTRMKAIASQALARGHKKEAAEDADTFRKVIDVLTQMSSTIGDKQLSTEDFSAALRIVFQNTEIGSIPTAADEVTVGSASMLRVSGVRCVILLGVCEEKFPAKISDSGLLSDNDRRILSDLGINLSGNTADSVHEELLYCYRAMTAASERLFVLYHAHDEAGKTTYPSRAIMRVCELLPYLQIRTYGEYPDDRLKGRQLAFEALPSLVESDVAETVSATLAETPFYATQLERSRLPVTCNDFSIRPETAAQVHGKQIGLSQRLIDSFASCQLAYYCNHVLKLTEDKRNRFHFADIGTLIHRILEAFVKAVTDENGLCKEMDVDKIRHFVRSEVDAYIAETFPVEKTISPNLTHLFKRLSRLALAVALDLYNELRDSNFVPRLMETGISAPSIKLKDGTVVNIYGVVDRIDIYRTDDGVYVKVVDYKSGKKTFSIRDIEKGLNVQLLLYLFAVCRNTDPAFRKELTGDENAKVIPAGALYSSSKIARLKLGHETKEEEALDFASREVNRTGILLDNPEILHAVSNSEQLNYLAGIKKDKKGIYKGNALISKENLEALGESLDDIIRNIAETMKSGQVTTASDKTGNGSPCTYCQFHSVCRIGVNENQPQDDTAERE